MPLTAEAYALTDRAFSKTVAGNNLIYHYTFKLGDGCTVRDLKDKLKRLDFDLLSVKDTYIRAQIEKRIVIIIFLSYFVTRLMLVRHLEKINLSEILKERE